MKPQRRSIALFLSTGLLIFAGIAIYLTTSQRLVGAEITPPKPMPDFSLSAKTGPVSLSDYRGKLVVLYFGYTSCPDVCPTTLANLRQARQLLSKSQADQVQVVFISVDWKRDTPANIFDYAHAFDPTFVGLTGSQAAIDQATKAYGIYYKLNEPDAKGYYSVEHTASTSVLDRQGNLVALWSYGQSPSDIAADIKILLRR